MNRNTLFAQLFVDSLIAAGLKHVCLAPGSRNTPLVLAFANRKEQINVTSHLDERSMAFFALGLARAANTPVAIVCTSGSAAANFFPAIVEAHQSRIPLIVLTADRPPELRHSGANQTIDQVKMFGDYALWFVDAPLPEANPSQHLLRYVRTLAHRAFDTANGARKGVVHINMPFRPPLEPTMVEGDLGELPEGFVVTETSTEEIFASRRPVVIDKEWVQKLDSAQRGLIVIGPNAWRILDEPVWTTLRTFAQHMGFPIIADGTSGVRFKCSFDNHEVIGAYDAFLTLKPALLEEIDLIIRFGDVPTSKALNTYLNSLRTEHYYQVTSDGIWADDSYRVTKMFHIDDWFGLMEFILYEQITEENKIPPSVIAEFAVQYSLQETPKDNPKRAERRYWASQVYELEKRTWHTLVTGGREFEGAFVRDMLNSMPENSVLVVGNSMPVRHLDFWGQPNNKSITVYANRGASGIDGNISTALGAGYGQRWLFKHYGVDISQPLVLLIGDVTFYHDMNGLLAIRRCGIPIVIVLLNNNGGGIFRTLPVKDYEPSFTDYFITPHTLDFSHVGPLYGLDHQRLTTRAEFRAAFPKAIDAWREGKSTLLEVMTDSNVDVATRREILAQVQEKLKSKSI